MDLRKRHGALRANLEAERIDLGSGWGVDRFDRCPFNDDELCATCESFYLAHQIAAHDAEAE